MDHPLHRTIGKLIMDHFSSDPFEVLLDQACEEMEGAKRNLPLFVLEKNLEQQKSAMSTF